jgi:hypothetical protein
MGTEQSTGNGEVDLHVLMPIYNDWQAASLLIAKLDRVLAGSRLIARVVLADDGSTTDPPVSITAPCDVGNRSGSPFIPARDYGLFVESCRPLRIERAASPLGVDSTC